VDAQRLDQLEQQERGEAQGDEEEAVLQRRSAME
jgi:hypothetical protein